ncbi:PEP-CTERM sorting domain-containing protein [Coraliomargarita algicola]|uniref:PEP-CTERM sorting domain-containing protein n=1 Tax=Coraliomargarita algicola TaxID=3092156 RepID=A0ABZ0RHS2_9BACT|nr:PEP-CTERM sorting domain-containing protein [Coraliomargarita sp. J2-16]WPJ94618.1 PEP-CTERM sorting domain-containing protein [Coraliomargarita sp. J2-16]
MNNKNSLIALALGLATFTTSADAIVNIQIQEIGSDVVITGSGTINTTELSAAASNDIKGLNLAFGFFTIGASDNSYLVTVTGPGGGVLGTDGYTPATSVSGDAMGFGSGGSSIVVPVGYVSGDPLSGSGIWAGESLESLELNVGSYSWTWGSGANADSMHVTIVPEPSSAALLVGCAALGFASRRRKRQS